MRYSVYDHTRRVYDYYEAPGPRGTHAGSPPKPRSVGELGAAASRASWRLPIGARKVGSGDLPLGRIAAPAGLGDTQGGSAVSPTTVVAYAAIAILAWRLLR